MRLFQMPSAQFFLDTYYLYCNDIDKKAFNISQPNAPFCLNILQLDLGIPVKRFSFYLFFINLADDLPTATSLCPRKKTNGCVIHFFQSLLWLIFQYYLELSFRYVRQENVFIFI